MPPKPAAKAAWKPLMTKASKAGNRCALLSKAGNGDRALSLTVFHGPFGPGLGWGARVREPRYTSMSRNPSGCVGSVSGCVWFLGPALAASGLLLACVGWGVRHDRWPAYPWIALRESGNGMILLASFFDK